MQRPLLRRIQPKNQLESQVNEFKLQKLAEDIVDFKKETEVKVGNIIEKAESVASGAEEAILEVKNLPSKIKNDFKELTNEIVDALKEIKSEGLKGDKGEDADEEAIEKRLLAKIPEIDIDDIAEKASSLVKPTPASLKIIKESVELKDEEIVPKLNKATNLGDLKLSINNIKDWNNKWEDIKGEISRNKGGYHGGGFNNIANASGTVSTGLDTLKFTGSGVSSVTQTGRTVTVDIAGGGGSGTVTDVSVASANGFAGSVATSTSTPVITLSTTITGLVKANGTALSAAVANTDYQSPIILTTTGTSGAATFNGTTLNIPNYTSGGGTPGGSDTQLQYNNAGSFGGISGATTNGTTVTFTTGNLIGADVKANSSAGLQILSNAGTVTALFGAGGGANSTFYGGSKFDYATASTVPYLDASKNLISSAVTPTELGYLSGVTSSIQTQIGTKVTGPASATDNAVVRFDNTTGKLVQDSAVTIADTSGDITGGKYNKVTITAPATGSTLTIADGQTLTVNGSATITNGTHSGTNTGDQTASTLAIAKLSTPAVDTVQEYLDSTGSSGYFSGGEITNGAAGTVNIAAGAGFIRATNSTTAQLLSFEWSAFSNVAIASDTTKYIYISYNGGSPTYVLSATATDEDPTKILVGIATNEGGTIVATLNAGVRLDESIGEAGRYIRRVFGFVRDSSVGGLIVSGTGTRNIALSAGTLWYGRTMYNISAIDTSGAGTFATYYRNGSGGFTKTSSVTQWNNTQYDNGTGTLATLAANKWAVAWLYVSADGLFYYVYGRASHTSQAAAETEALPATLPNVITAGTLLVGRLIFQKSASTATFYSAFTNTFSNTGVTLHNDLGSIQGGTTGEYYHLTSAEYTGTGTGNFVRATSPTLTSPTIATSQTNSYATASTIGIFNGSKQLISADTATYPSLTELSYVKGVTSAIQTQLNGKQAALTNPVTGTGTNNEIAFFNSTGSTIGSLTTATYPSLTELSYVKGVTSSIQTQLNAKGTGTVTSVGASFTGGLISIGGSPVTTSGTLALTVAGTSGGIPYFSSTSAWASSALLAANSLMIGGGAGAAPSTTTTGTGVLTALGVNVGSAGAFVTFNGALGTPSSGTVTNLTGTASININGTVGATTPDAGTFTTGTINTSLTMADGANIILNSTTGTKIGTATTQKLAFFNSVPIVQPTGSVITALQNLGLGASLTIPASTITSGAALTKTDDTNVTLTLGGSPTTALLAASSLTLGWTGTLAVARGGTGGGSASITLFNNITGYTASGATGTTSTNLVFSTSPSITTPTFVTSATVPLIIGGTGTTSTLTLQPTSGVGASGSDIIFKVGNNGGTEAMRIDYLGNTTMTVALNVPQVFNAMATATVTSNAATITRANRNNKFTNSSAAAMTITLSTTSAAAGDMLLVQIYDFSAVAQTITWVNTENSTVTVPATSNGSTTLPLTVGFMWNASTSKWRVMFYS